MGKISSFVFFDDIEFDEQNKPKFGSPLGSIALPSLPSFFSFWIVFILSDVTVDKNTAIVVNLYDNTSNLIFSKKYSNLKDQGKGKIRGFVLDARNTQIFEEGLLRAEVMLDDELLGAFSLPVVYVGGVQNVE